MADCDDRQLSEAQRQAGYQNQRTGVQQAIRPFSGRPTIENLIDYINRELQPAVRAVRNKVNDVYLPVVDNAPSGNPLGFYFSTNTASGDPTAGRIRLNASPQDTATVMRVSQSSGRLVDVAPWLDVMSGGATTPLGVVTLTDAINPTRFIRFDLSTMVDQGAYWDLTVAAIESSHDDPFVDGGAVVVSFIPGVGGVTPATVPPSSMTAIAANTVLANATAAPAAPTAVSVGANTVLGRVAGNIVAAQLVNAQITDATIANAKLANMVAARVKGVQVDGSTGAPQDLTGLEVGELLRIGTAQSATLTADTNDLSLNADTTVLRVGSGTGSWTLTGMTGGVSGRLVSIENSAGSGTNITLASVDSGSVAANRFRTPGAVALVLRFRESALARWDSNTSDWRIIGSSRLASAQFPGAPIYDVMQPPFSAVGNGTSDDTAAINAAIVAANAAPGAIYLGDDHRITAGLTPITADGVTVRGRGAVTGGTLVRVDAAAAPTAVFHFDGCTNIGIEDVQIRGVGALYTTGCGVYFDACTRGYVRRCVIRQIANAVEIHESILTDVSNCTLDNLYGEYGVRSHGTTVACHATHISRCLGENGFLHTVVGDVAAWQAGTAYVVNNAVMSDGKVYQCVTAGTSGGVGPSGIPATTVATAYTATLTDGSVAWALAMPLNTWFLQDSHASTFRVIDCATLGGGYGLRVIDAIGATPEFTRVVNLECDHIILGGVRLEGGRQAEFQQLFVTSIYAGPAVEITATHEGDWLFNGGFIFGISLEGFVISADQGSIANFAICGCGTRTTNTYDAIRIDAGVEHWNVSDCTIGFAHSSSALTRYGIGIGSGCNNYVIADNRIIGHDTGAINDVPGAATTRVTQGNVPTSVNTVRIDEVEPMGVGTVVGRRVDAGSTGRPVALTGAEVGELLRMGTAQSVTLSGGTTNDLSLNADTTVLRVGSTTGAQTLTGISGGSAGRLLCVESSAGAGNPITLASLDAGSLTANRLRTPLAAAFVLGQRESCILRWDSTNGDWRLIAAARGAAVNDGDYGDITVTASGATWTIDPAVVTNAKLANMVAARVKGVQVDGSTGAPQDLTGAEVAELLRFGTIQNETLAATTNNLTINADTTVLRVGSVTGSQTLTGMTGGTAGRLVSIENVSGSGTNITLTSLDAGSLTANRFRTPNGVALVLRFRESALARWDSTNGDWRFIGTAQDAAITDGDKGDITVSASGATWTVDANIAKTWTGIHSFTGASHTVNVTGAVAIDADAASNFTTSVGNLTLSTAAAGSRVIVSGADDVLIEAVTDDVFITAGDVLQATATTRAQVRSPSLNLTDAAGTGHAYLSFVASAAAASGNVPSGLLGITADGSVTPPQLIKADSTSNLGAWPINMHGVGGNTAILATTNSTGAITAASFNMPGSTARVGTTYEYQAFGTFTRGGTATALDLVFDLTVNGVAVATMSQVTLTSAATYGWSMSGAFTIISIGAGGTFVANMSSLVEGSVATTPSYAHSRATATTAIDTVVATGRLLSIRCNMSAAVASATLSVTNASIRRVI